MKRDGRPPTGRRGPAATSLGAMAVAIAGARDGVSSIPSRWIEALEDGPRGRSYVLQVAGALAAAAA